MLGLITVHKAQIQYQVYISLSSKIVSDLELYCPHELESNVSSVFVVFLYFLACRFIIPCIIQPLVFTYPYPGLAYLTNLSFSHSNVKVIIGG
jgi:hypothetical protein